MMRSHFSLAMAGVLAVLFSFLDGSPAQARRLVPVDSEPASAAGVVVTVHDEAGVVANARVWVETAEGKLLVQGTTAGDGRFDASVSDEALRAGVSITAAAAGHGAVSCLQNIAHRVSFELPMALVDAYATLTGNLTGFKDNDDESRAAAGLVAKALELSDLVGLDSSAFISPLKDEVDIFGPRNLPSNLVLPDQTLPVYFIPVHVNKPTFRLPVLAGSSSRYFGVTGSVSVQDTVNAIRNNSGWDIVNLLNFEKVGVTNPLPAASAGQELSLDVNTDLALKDAIHLKPGRNLTAGDDSHRLAVALWEASPGVFVPTDVKQVLSDDVQLATVDRARERVMDVLIGKDGDHFRGAWVAATGTEIPDAGLTADMTMGRVDDAWVISGGGDAQLLIAHVETQKTMSVGNHRYEDRWIVVGPRRAQLRLPAVAYKDLQAELGKISHVSVDLLQTAAGGYAFIDGEAAGRDLISLEKIRKEVQ